MAVLKTHWDKPISPKIKKEEEKPVVPKKIPEKKSGKEKPIVKEPSIEDFVEKNKYSVKISE